MPQTIEIPIERRHYTLSSEGEAEISAMDFNKQWFFAETEEYFEALMSDGTWRRIGQHSLLRPGATLHETVICDATDRVYIDGTLGIGIATPATLVELWSGSSHPILTISAGALTNNFDPQVQFRTGDGVSFSLGVDNDDDFFKIFSGEGIGDTSEFVIDTSGKVGIGTDEPSSLLEIRSDTADPILTISSASGNGFTPQIRFRRGVPLTLMNTIGITDGDTIFIQSNEGLDTADFVIHNNGEIGFGTGFPLLNAGGSAGDFRNTGVTSGVHIKGGIDANDSTYFILEGAGTTANGNPAGANACHFVLASRESAGNLKLVEWCSGSNTTSFNALNDDTTMKIQNILVLESNNGYVGIGVAAPDTNLHIFENNAETTPAIKIENDGVGDASLEFNRTDIGSFTIGMDNPGDFFNFKIGPGSGLDGNNYFVMNENGNVGFGTASPNYQIEIYKSDGHPIIHIDGDHATDYDPQIQFATGSTTRFTLGVDGVDDKFKIFSGEGIGDTSGFVIDTNGKVGVGTDSPISILELQDDDADVVLALTAKHNTAYNPIIDFRTGDTPTTKYSMGVLSSGNTFHITLGAGLGREFVMDTTGWIGIGSPGTVPSILELYSNLHTTLTISCAHDTDYDPQIHFRTDTPPTTKFSIGVDGANDFFKIFSGEGIGDTSEFVLDLAGNLGIGTAAFQAACEKNLAIKEGVAPAALTADQIYIWAQDDGGTAEAYVQDGAGNQLKFSPHSDAGEWEFQCKNIKTGRILNIQMEQLVKFLDKKFGTNFLTESKPL